MASTGFDFVTISFMHSSRAFDFDNCMLFNFFHLRCQAIIINAFISKITSNIFETFGPLSIVTKSLTFHDHSEHVIVGSSDIGCLQEFGRCFETGLSSVLAESHPCGLVLVAEHEWHAEVEEDGEGREEVEVD